MSAKAKIEHENLKDQANHLEQEARMVLPGLQALFGFQFICVFNERFTSLVPRDQNLHWVALALTAAATALMIAPAAYHRQVERTTISDYFINLASRLMTMAMALLMIALCLDFFLIGKVISGDQIFSSGMAIILFLFFLWLWFIFPAFRRRAHP